MITLKFGKSKPRWERLDLTDEDHLRIEITPPTYQQVLTAACGTTTEAVLAARLECVTNWQEVYDVRDEDGARFEVPFSRDALGMLLTQFPGALAKLSELVRPLFVGEPKRANAQPSAPLSDTAAT